MMLSPFCYVNNANKIPKDGYLFQVPLFCKRSFNQKCKSYYDEIREKEGFSCCPYGFASLGIKKSSLVYIFTCLNLERVSNNKLIRKRITKKDSILKFSIENFKNRIEYYLGIETNFLEAKLEKEKYGELNSSINEKQDFFDNIFHELRKLNKQLKREIEALIKECNIGKISLEQINNKSQHIFAISQLITIRLNTFDFNQNPDLIIEGNQKDTIIFGKFKKIMHCLEYTAQLKNINLNINGKTTCKIKAFDIFELLPYLYIENAIKYSPDSHTVTVNFIHVDTKLIITIENLGPLVSPEELKMIGEKGVRGKYAEELKFGSGIGLFLANSICNLHDIHFSYESSGIINDINKIPYKTFTVKLEVCENN